MGYIFDDWKQILNDFQSSVEKDLAEIHKQKEAVQQMKTEIFDRLDNGKYICDEHRIVLSAPEIIIGHVDKSGDLKGGSKVIIRGTEVDVEGVGESSRDSANGGRSRYRRSGGCGLSSFRCADTGPFGGASEQ